GLLNGRIDYTLEDRGLTFALFGTNILDERYDTQISDLTSQIGFVSSVTAEPRMWGVSVRKTFGGE
ncbi:MAG: hypothetical protein ABW063_10340, partial [Caulobacter sp.]